MKRIHSAEFFSVNLRLLGCFKTPTTKYEIAKRNIFSSYYSGAHKAVKKLLSQVLISLASTTYNEKNTIKKIYVITEKGRRLLELFPQNLEDAEEVA
jgi:DNA-binding PadR family transcriptional regulator